MIGIDTNLLVFGHREESVWYDVAYRLIEELSNGLEHWAIPWPCLHEFLGVVTHPRVFTPPTPLPVALAQVDAWLESPSLVLLSESGTYWPELRRQLTTGRVSGPRVHDARIAALCRLHGVRELWTADRDFGRFPDLRTRNPLVR